MVTAEGAIGAFLPSRTSERRRSSSIGRDVGSLPIASASGQSRDWPPRDGVCTGEPVLELKARAGSLHGILHVGGRVLKDEFPRTSLPQSHHLEHGLGHKGVLIEIEHDCLVEFSGLAADFLLAYKVKDH